MCTRDDDGIPPGEGTTSVKPPNLYAGDLAETGESVASSWRRTYMFSSI